jgi:hypothetical protein
MKLIFNWIQIPKLKWNELNTIFFSFGFNMVNDVLIEIWIELNLVEFKIIQFISFQIGLNQFFFIIFLWWIQRIMNIQLWKGTY